VVELRCGIFPSRDVALRPQILPHVIALDWESLLSMVAFAIVLAPWVVVHFLVVGMNVHSNSSQHPSSELECLGRMAQFSAKRRVGASMSNASTDSTGLAMDAGSMDNILFAMSSNVGQPLPPINMSDSYESTCQVSCSHIQQQKACCF